MERRFYRHEEIKELLERNNSTALIELEKLYEEARKNDTWVQDEILLRGLTNYALTTREFDKLRERAKASVVVDKAIKLLVPKIIKELEAGYSLKNDGTLYEKDKKRFSDIAELAREKFKGLHYYLEFGDYSITLKVRKSYQVSLPDRTLHVGGHYFEEYIYIYDRQQEQFFDSAKNLKGCKVTYKQLLKAEKDLADAEKKISELESKKYAAKRLLGY